MREEVDGRVVLHCDRCGARIEAGRVMPNSLRPERTPSGWLSLEGGKHACSLCARAEIAAFRGGGRVNRN